MSYQSTDRYYVNVKYRKWVMITELVRGSGVLSKLY